MLAPDMLAMMGSSQGTVQDQFIPYMYLLT